jgi:energy-converting hydrogenase Eha subunit C
MGLNLIINVSPAATSDFQMLLHHIHFCLTGHITQVLAVLPCSSIIMEALILLICFKHCNFLCISDEGSNLLHIKTATSYFTGCCP